MEKEVICAELGVELSDKPEDNLTFRSTFEFIGAAFDTTDHKYIIRRPARYIRDALERDMEWIITHKCQLVGLSLLQLVVGRLKFWATFVELGRYHINSSYVELVADRHMKCHSDVAMISAEMAGDIELLSSELRLERWEKLVASAKFEYPVVQGLASGTVAYLRGGGGVRVWNNSLRHMGTLHVPAGQQQADIDQPPRIAGVSSHGAAAQ